jgi:hypothetical protein
MTIDHLEENNVSRLSDHALVGTTKVNRIYSQHSAQTQNGYDRCCVYSHSQATKYLRAV